MKTLTMALLAGAIAAAPIAASAQSHGGGGFHGGGGGGGFHGGGGYGGYHGGYGGYRGGYGGYRGGWGGYGWGFGGFGLGLALGAAYYNPWYYGYGGYYGYGYPGYGYAGYGPSAWDDDYDDYNGAPGPASAPPATYQGGYGAAPAASPSAQACGQWVWHADQNKYQWAPGACT